MELVCHSVSGDGTGGTDQHAAQTQENTASVADRDGSRCAGAEGCDRRRQQAALAQQQQQIQELRDELHNRDQAAQQAQSAATDAASKADAAQAQASQQQQTVTELKTDVTDLKTNMASTVVTVQETQKNLAGPPTAIHVKGITITPGGFLAAETVYRSKALGGGHQHPI